MYYDISMKKLHAYAISVATNFKEILNFNTYKPTTRRIIFGVSLER